MKLGLPVLAAAISIAPLAAIAADVGVSIQFSQPGVYGRIDLGQYPQPPQVIVAQPVMVVPPPPCRRVTESIGTNIATNTMPAVRRCTSSTTVGTNATRWRTRAMARATSTGNTGTVTGMGTATGTTTDFGLIG